MILSTEYAEQARESVIRQIKVDRGEVVGDG
jgi:hypothetical protein